MPQDAQGNAKTHCLLGQVLIETIPDNLPVPDPKTGWVKFRPGRKRNRMTRGLEILVASLTSRERKRIF